MSTYRYAEPTRSEIVPQRDPAPTKPRSLYFPTLDGLRFFAFALVLLNHLPAPKRVFLESLVHNGWVGVPIFLTLSAYLLTAILVTEYQQAGQVSVSRFYIRRLLRIWPL